MVLGHSYVCPTHNVLGCVKLVVATMVERRLDGAQQRPDPGRRPGSPSRCRGARRAGSQMRRSSPATSTSLCLEELLEGGGVSTGGHSGLRRRPAPVQPGEPAGGPGPGRRARHPAGAGRLPDHRERLVHPAPRDQPEIRQIAEIVRQMVKTSHIFQIDGAQDPKCNTGGILTTDNPDDHEKLMNEVVVYEGLHTYGGMAGRTMEMLARGSGRDVRRGRSALGHAPDREVHRAAALTQACPWSGAAMVPISWQTSSFPICRVTNRTALSAALYQLSGRSRRGHRAGGPRLPGADPDPSPGHDQPAARPGRGRDHHALRAARQASPRLEPISDERWRDQMRYRWVFADLESLRVRHLSLS